MAQANNASTKRTILHTFFGRAEQVNSIKEYIFNFIFDVSRDSGSDVIQIINIAGPPGIGKTKLAKHVLKEMELDCMEHGISFKSYFIDLQNENNMGNVLKQIGIEMCCSSSHKSGRKLIRELHSRVTKTTSELLVLDGVEGLLSDDEAGREFLELCQELIARRSSFQNNAKRFLLVTSTIKFQLPRLISKLYTLPLLPLTLNEVKEGFLRMCRQEEFGSSLEDLAECAAGYPIAVILIGAIVKARNIHPKDLVDSLRRDWTATLISGDADNQMNRVRSVINVCLKKLPRQLRKDYTKLAYIPASFTAETASFMTSTPGEVRSSVIVKHDVILPLHDRCFLEVHHLLDPMSGRQRFHIHQVLRSFVEDRYHLLDQDLNEVRNRYCVFYGQLLLKISPLLDKDYASHLPVFTIEIRNIEKLLREAVHCLGENTVLFLEAAYESHVIIETFLPTEEAVEFYKACVNAAQMKERPGGVDKLSEARMLLVYGKMLGAAKTDFELEYEQYKKCMRLLRPRGDTVEMATLLCSMAGNLHSRGKRFDAIKTLHDTLTVLDRLENYNSRAAGIPGPVVTEQRATRATEIKPEAALAIRRIRANATHMLGVIYTWIGKTKQAEKCHLESLQMKRELWGENHPSVGSGYNGLSLMYEKTGESNKAAHFCFLGLKVRRKLLKEEPSIGVIVSLNNSARHLSLLKGEHQRALDLLDEAYRMREKLGINHRDTSLIFNNRGKVYSWMGDWKNAMINFAKAVELRLKFIGSHASTAGSMYLLGNSYLKSDLPHLAVESLTECLKMIEAVHMKEQPLSEERAKTLEPLAKAYRAMGNLEEAMTYYDKTVVELTRLAIEHMALEEESKHASLERKIEIIKLKRELVKLDIEKQSCLIGTGLHWKLICTAALCCAILYWLWCNCMGFYLNFLSA
ncbi:uncharacterized protein [Amphiura filiformis]|uniref:uncharacterized protein n=1 Tax=Amphiura filiformis TaxID=82378 RepID=UPI003B20C3ED